MRLYVWKIFHENAIKMVSIIPSNGESEAPIFRKHYNFAISHRNQWKQLVLVNERMPWFHSWRIPFSVVPIHGTVHHKNESWSDGISLFRKNQKCSFVKCTQVIGNFSMMLSIVGILDRIFNIWATSRQNQQNDCAPSKGSDQPGYPPSLIRVFTVCMKKAWVLSYPLSTQRRLWSDWADAQADLSLCWAHSHIVGFVMRRLICIDRDFDYTSGYSGWSVLRPLAFTLISNVYVQHFDYLDVFKYMAKWERFN